MKSLSVREPYGNDYFENNSKANHQSKHPFKVGLDWDNRPFDFNFVADDSRNDHTSRGRSVTNSTTDSTSSSNVHNSPSHDLLMRTPKYRTKKLDNKSYLDGKLLKDIEREQQAKKRALQLSESMMSVRALGHVTPHGSPTSVRLSASGHHTAFMASASNSPNDESRMADRANHHFLRKTQDQISQTESSRPRISSTSYEDFGEIKKPLDIYLEKEARKKASIMISNGKWSFNELAGLAIWSPREVPKKREGHGGVCELV